MPNPFDDMVRQFGDLQDLVGGQRIAQLRKKRANARTPQERRTAELEIARAETEMQLAKDRR